MTCVAHITCSLLQGCEHRITRTFLFACGGSQVKGWPQKPVDPMTDDPAANRAYKITVARLKNLYDTSMAALPGHTLDGLARFMNAFHAKDIDGTPNAMSNDDWIEVMNQIALVLPHLTSPQKMIDIQIES